MNLGRKDDISPMQENVVLSDSEGESERAPPPFSLSLLLSLFLPLSHDATAICIISTHPHLVTSVRPSVRPAFSKLIAFPSRLRLICVDPMYLMLHSQISRLIA